MNTAVHQPEGSRAPGLIRLARSKLVLRNLTVRTPGFITGALALSCPPLPRAVRRGFHAPYRSADRRTAIAEFVADIPLEPDHPSAPALEAIAAGLDDMQDVPVLLVWGSGDKVFSDLYLHDLERRLPQADVHRYARASHFVSEDVDAFGPIVDWVASLDDGHPEPAGRVRPTTLFDVPAWSGSAVAIAGGEGEDDLRFSDFSERVSATATWLLEEGVAAGDRVGLMIPPGVELATALYAAWRIGAVAVLIDSGLGQRGMHAAVRSADPAFLVGIRRAVVAARVLRWPGRRLSTDEMSAAQQRWIGSSGSLGPVPRADDPAAVVFTSGATGPSKGVRYTFGQLEAQRDALRRLYDIGTDDRLVAAFAPFALYGPALGIASIVPEMDVGAPGTLTARALGDAAVAVDATIVFASPAALVNVMATTDEITGEHRASFGRVRLVLSAGAPVRPSLLRQVARLFPNAAIRTPYGMTECLPVADISLEEIESVADGDGVCVGHPVADVDVAIRPLDAEGRPAGDLVRDPGVVGEVVVRADHARSGYDRLWHTEHLASNPPGWHATGDVGHLDDAGQLWIGGRIGHVISTEHGPVTPVAVEHAIEAIDRVRAAAVVGVGPPGVQQIVAVVQTDVAKRSLRLADLALVDAVRGAAGQHIAAVLEVGELPVDRRHNSKIDRTRLAARAATLLAGGRLREP
jgi:acyl-coenzyme A synthetase/AMP-(fatty) acid ligase